MSSSALGKRKAGDEPVAGATVANVSAARGPPVVSRRRERAMRQELRWLNSCFSQYVSARADSSEPLDGAAEDYLRYVRQIRAQYSDVLAPATPLQRRCGRVYVVGTGDMGQLGLGDDEDGIMVCQRPHPLDAFGLPVCVVACGGMHSLAITDDGGVWSWGVNDDGPLGRELPADVGAAGAENQTGWTPDRVALPPGVTVVAVSCGDSHSVALASDGRVFAWGTFRDKSGVMGFSSTARVQRSPALVFEPSTPDERVVAISSGADHVLLLSADGCVRSFGCAEKGRLGRFEQAQADVAIGDAPAADRSELLRRVTLPAVVRGLGRVTAVAAGFFCSFAVTATGDVYAWGLNNYGQLGLPQVDANQLYLPARVPLLSGRGVKDMVSGEHHTLALTTDGTLLSFGRPTYGRLGRPDVDVETDIAEHEPKPVPGFGEDPVVSIAAGIAVSAAVTASGAMYAWGYGETSMLGKDDDADEVTPCALTAAKRFPATGGIAVALGGQHAAWLAAAPPDAIDTEAPAKKLHRLA